MNLPQDKFCVLPWISLEASPIGTVRPCCLADDEIVDDEGNKFELIHANFARHTKQCSHAWFARTIPGQVNNHKHAANAGLKNVQVAQAKECTHWTD
jgi:hypothetical protein